MGIRVHNLGAGARGRLALARDDRDRHDLVARMAERLGPALLAYCVMNTHIHVVAEGWADDVGGALQAALAAYIRGFNRRHGASAGLLRGPVDDRLITDPSEVGRAIHYVHENPLRVSAPTVERPIEYRWSSQREFDGISLAETANVGRTLELLGPKASTWVYGRSRVALADAAPVAAPTASLGTLLAAAADAFGVPWWEVTGSARAPALEPARTLFVRLGGLEGYSLRQLGAAIGRSKTRACELGSQELPDRAVRIARTLIRTPALRRQLPAIPPPPSPPPSPGRTAPRPNEAFGPSPLRP